MKQDILDKIKSEAVKHMKSDRLNCPSCFITGAKRGYDLRNEEVENLQGIIKAAERRIQELKDKLSDMKGFFVDGNTPL